MKRITILSILIIGMMIITACGSSTPNIPPTQPPATEPPATEVQPTQPAATEVPATQPAGAESPTAASGATQVDITLVDNKIQSPVTTFQVGAPYTFVITNAGQHAHNFNISTPVSVAGSLEAAFQSALLAVPQDQLGAGASVTVEYTFPDSAVGQTLEFSCLIRRHYEDGMLLPITVTQ